MDFPKRKQNRLQQYDYSTYGGYFVTICTENNKPLFWCAPEKLSEIGKIVNQTIQKIPVYYPTVSVEKYVIMPNHIHILLLLENHNTETAPSLSQIMKQLKGYVTKQVGYPIWQKSYYDRVVRTQEEYQKIWEYIDNNPLALSLKRSGDQ